jgi:hypothetical protein
VLDLRDGKIASITTILGAHLRPFGLPAKSPAV